MVGGILSWRRRKGEESVNILVGLVLALAVAGGAVWVSGLIRPRVGGGLKPAIATAAGVAVGALFWFGLDWWTPVVPQVSQGIGIGLAVGLSQGLRRPEDTKRQ